MEEMQLLFAGARSATVDLAVPGLYAPEKEVTFTLNGVTLPPPETVVVTLFDLLPSTDYTLVCDGRTLTFRTEEEKAVLDIREFGAVGDGIHDDTSAIQAAIMLCPAHGRVLVPAGHWSVLPLFLKSGVRIELAEGAVLELNTDRSRFPVLPGTIACTDGDIHTGTWEGSPDSAFASLFTGLFVEDVAIFGRGTIDGRAQKGDWWKEPKKRRIAWRGNMFFTKGCRDITLQGIQVQNSPCWNLHPFDSDDLRFLNVSVSAPKDSPNTDGLDPECCNGVLIAGCHFSLGDDCIAVKSSKPATVDRRPCENIVITHCLMENGHGGVTVGSEMAGGVYRMIVRDTMMRNTDRGLRIKTRRGRSDRGVIDGIIFDNVRMEQVGTALVVNSLYFCDPDGHSPWVQSLEKQPVDKTTPRVGELTFRHVTATGCACAGYFLGLPEKPVESLVLEDVTVECDPDAAPMQPAMADCVPKMTRTGFVIRFVDRFTMHNVKVTGCEGDWLQADSGVTVVNA